MDRSDLTPRTASGVALEQALADWMDASRRAYDASRDLRDEQAEHLAWCRVQSALSSADLLAAA